MRSSASMLRRMGRKTNRMHTWQRNSSNLATAIGDASKAIAHQGADGSHSKKSLARAKNTRLLNPPQTETYIHAHTRTLTPRVSNIGLELSLSSGCLVPRNYSNWRAGNPKSTCWHCGSSNPSSGFHSTALRHTMWWAYQKAEAPGALKVVHSSDELRHRHNSQEQNPDGWSLFQHHFHQHGWLETNLTIWTYLAQFHLFANGRTLKKGREAGDVLDVCLAILSDPLWSSLLMVPTWRKDNWLQSSQIIQTKCIQPPCHCAAIIYYLIHPSLGSIAPATHQLDTLNLSDLMPYHINKVDQPRQAATFNALRTTMSNKMLIFSGTKLL